MTARLDDLLEPGERVLHRARLNGRTFAARLLSHTAVLFVFACGLFLLCVWLSRQTGSLPFLLCGLALLSIAWTQLGVGEIVVTNQRLLRRKGVVRRQVTELSLSEVQEIEGLQAGSRHRLMLKRSNGELIDLEDFSDARKLARAIAEAADLAIPEGVAALPERAAWLFEGTVAICQVLGCLLAFGAVIWLAFLDVPWFVRGLAVLTVLTFIVPTVVGGIVGVLSGGLLAIAYLRPILTHDEMLEVLAIGDQRTRRQAAKLFDPAKAPLAAGDYRPWAQPILMRLAGLFYGSPGARPEEEENGYGR